MRVRTYLNFGGNCEAAFRFYEKNLGGKIGMMMTFDQMPPDPRAPAHPPAKGILHASITLGDIDIMASDVPDGRFQPVRSSYLCLSVDSDAEAERVYKVLSDGGEVFMEIGETFFATKFAQLRDKFGVLWMIIHEKPMGPPQG